MPRPIRIRNPRGELVEAAHFSASDAKNGFGRILDQVVKRGGVTITKRNEPYAVVISVETYQRLVGAEARTLNTLSEEFDTLLEDMQAPGAAKAMQSAFDMMPEELGRAAVHQAALAAKQRREAAKVKPSSKAAVGGMQDRAGVRARLIADSDPRTASQLTTVKGRAHPTFPPKVAASPADFAKMPVKRAARKIRRGARA